jgi:hypothetical protein
MNYGDEIDEKALEAAAIALNTEAWVRSSIDGWPDHGAHIRGQLRNQARGTIAAYLSAVRHNKLAYSSL